MQQNQKNDNSMLVAVGLIKTFAATLYTPLRVRMGRDHLGIGALLGPIFIFIWSELARAPGLLWLVPINVLCTVLMKIGQLKRRLTGVIEHTEYGGSSWLAGIVFRDEDAAKRFGEPLISILIGTLVYYYSTQPNAAPYFWWGGAAMFWWHSYVNERERRFIDAMNNAAIENHYFMNKLKRRL